jgi:hypothetical protein
MHLFLHSISTHDRCVELRTHATRTLALTQAQVILGVEGRESSRPTGAFYARLFWLGLKVEKFFRVTSSS